MTERDPYSEMHHRDDLAWIVRRLRSHAEAAEGRQDLLLARHLESAIDCIEQDREAAKKAHPWQGRAVAPKRSRGVQ